MEDIQLALLPSGLVKRAPVDIKSKPIYSVLSEIFLAKYSLLQACYYYISKRARTSFEMMIIG